jgi:hypothetical protein
VVDAVDSVAVRVELVDLVEEELVDEDRVEEEEELSVELAVEEDEGDEEESVEERVPSVVGSDSEVADAVSSTDKVGISIVRRFVTDPTTVAAKLEAEPQPHCCRPSWNWFW